MHGDKNKADDVSWPFYTAIDEVLGKLNPRAASSDRPDNDEDEEDELNPQEFLCVSVAPDDYADDVNQLPTASAELDRVTGPVFDVDRDARTNRYGLFLPFRAQPFPD